MLIGSILRMYDRSGLYCVRYDVRASEWLCLFVEIVAVLFVRFLDSLPRMMMLLFTSFKLVVKVYNPSI